MKNATLTGNLSPDSATKGGGTIRSLVALISIVALALGAGVVLADDTDIQYDMSSNAKTGSTAAHSLSWTTHTVTSENNRFMTVGVSLNHDTTTYAPITVNTITWTVGGTDQSFGQKQAESSVTGTDAARAEIWSLLAPTSGSGTVLVTLNNRTVTSETVVLSTSTTGVTNVPPSGPGSGELLGAGDGTATSFSGTIANTQVVRGSLTISAGTVTATDTPTGGTGVGVLTGTGVGSGSINYLTGAWSITYDTPPGNGTQIYATYGYGTWSFTGTLADPAVDPLSLTFSATVGGSTRTASDNGSGWVTGDSENITGTLSYTSGAWDLYFATPPDASTTITATYDHLNVADMIAGAVTFYNVNQTNPSTNGSAGDDTDTTPTVSVSTDLRNAVFGVVATTGPANSLTKLSHMTDRWNDTNGTGSSDTRAAGCTAPGEDIDTAIRWTLGVARKSAIAAINIIPVNSPTEARFAKARAFATESGTLVTWRTAHEVRNLGFRVHREDEYGNLVSLNRSLVAGSALFAGPNTELSVGRSYVYWDGEAGRNVGTYWLEAVDLDGRTTWHGPFLSQPASEKGPIRALEGMSAFEARSMSNPSLSGLGRNTSDQTPEVKGFKTGTRHTTDRVGGSQGQWRLAGAAAARILVDQAGWYRVTRAQFAAAGYDPGPDAMGLQFYNQGHEEAIQVSGIDDGIFDMDDAIEFYAEEVDTAATGTNVYWLTNGVRAGRRLNEVQVAAGAADPVPSYPAMVSLHDRSIYVAAVTRNGDRDNFYGPVVGADPVTQILNVDALPEAGVTQISTLEIALQGVTTADHRVAVSFNDHELEEMEFAGDVSTVRSFQIDPSWLRVGGNEVILEALEGDADISVTDFISLKWERPFLAMEDRLEMTAPAGSTVRVSGFSQETVRLFDLTNRYAPVEILGSVEQDADGSWAIEAALPTTSADVPRELYAVAESVIGTPAGLEANSTSSWHSGDNLADMVIISHSDLMPAAERLAAYRSAHGVSTVAVDISDLYDEFSFGIKDANAIRAFLAQSTVAWKVSPRYVLLMGDASVDPRNYLGFGDGDLVPTKILATNLLKTANDDWFADVDEDGLANLAVGRIPARSLEEADAMVAKIIGYEQDAPSGSWSENLTLVIDAVTGDFDFREAAEALEALVPGSLESGRIDLGDVGEGTGHLMIMEAFEEGRLLINYDGHGSQAVWASDEVFGNEHASNLRNGSKLPFVVAMNCLNGLFHDVYQDSLAEALLANPDGGAVMVWASSALTDPSGQDLMNRDLYRSLFGGDHPAVGDAVMAAKANVTDQDTRNTWILFGDPSMQLRE